MRYKLVKVFHLLLSGRLILFRCYHCERRYIKIQFALNSENLGKGRWVGSIIENTQWYTAILYGNDTRSMLNSIGHEKMA